MPGRDGHPAIAFTFDLHDVDLPEDILRTAERFGEAGLPATFFVPSAMLDEPRYRDALRRLPALGHEMGSHGHHHDWVEIDALMEGGASRLAFLAESRDRHAQFYGAAPTSFRSPRWCTLGRAAIERLAELGYVADSSATPQRLPVFSSRPFHPGWWWSPRVAHVLAPGLVEVPTSTLFVPAGSPTFLTLRSAGTGTFLGLLEVEARLPGPRALVLQFHVEDFQPDTARSRSWGRPSWRDLGLRARGGFRIKLFLRETDSLRIANLHERILGRYAGRGGRTITDLAREALPSTRQAVRA